MMSTRLLIWALAITAVILVINLGSIWWVLSW